MGGGHTHTAEETAPGGGQPGLAGKTKCVVPSVGKSDRAAREDVVLAQAALGHLEQHHIPSVSVQQAEQSGALSADRSRLTLRLSKRREG